jgi:hypothetical protein
MMTWSYLSTCEDKPLELRVVLRFLLRVRHPRSRRLTAWQKNLLLASLLTCILEEAEERDDIKFHQIICVFGFSIPLKMKVELVHFI